MSWLIGFLGPDIIKWLIGAVVAAGGVIGFLLNNMAQRRKGATVEREKTKAIVNQVQNEINSKTVKTPTTQETVDRLKKGTF